MKDATPILDIAAYAVKAALSNGANHAEAYIRYGAVSRFVFQGYQSVSESQGWQNGLALRVWRNNNLALLTTNNFSHANLEELAQYAVKEAHTRGVASVPLMHTEKRTPYTFRFHEMLEMPASEKVDTILQFLKMLEQDRLLDDAMIHTCYSDYTPWVAICNSHGFQIAYQTQHSVLWLWTETKTGPVRRSVFSRNFQDLSFDTLATRLNNHTACLDRSTGEIREGNYEVLLSPSAAADLARSLGILLTGENVTRYLPALLKHVGNKIASSAITLIDDATMATGLKSRPFDDEGTPTTIITLISKGRLNAFLHSLRTAAQLGIQPNGTATREALWQEPHSAPSNIYLQPGTATPEDLLHSMKQGIAVTNVLRPGMIQNETGNFTVVVQGWWVEDGERVYPVSSIHISANIFEILRNVRGCGNDLEFSYEANGAGAPSVLVDKMRVVQVRAIYE